jgi:N,N'-diacetylchitobiose transport system permease protein
MTAAPVSRPRVSGPRARPRPRRQVTRRNAKTFSLNAIAVLVALLTLFPIFWMVSTAFKPSQEIYSLTPVLWPAHPTLGNFHSVFSGQASGIGSYWLFFRNSMLVTLCTVLLASLVSLLASIAVARFRFRFRASYLILLLIVQMIPAQALIIALFLDFNRLNLLQSLPGLILVYSAQALPVSIWMLRNFVATVPRELEEAAAVDGAGALRIFWRILFPLVVPGLIATSVFSFITAYNEFIVALTFLGQAHGTYTLPIYVTYFFGRGGAEWGPIMAASTLYTIPVVVFFLLVQRRMTGGLVAGAVKG